MTDTSAEAVERLAREHDLVRFTLGMKAHEHDLTAATLRALLARADRAEAERDEAQRLVNEARGERDEAVATLALYRMEHGCTRGQRTTQWCGEAAKLREAGRPLHAAAVAAVGSLKPSDHKRARLAIACRDWRAALGETGHE